MCESSFCLSTALNFVYYTAHGRFSRNVKFHSESHELNLLFQVPARFYSAHENDLFVYIPKARK